MSPQLVCSHVEVEFSNAVTKVESESPATWYMEVQARCKTCRMPFALGPTVYSKDQRQAFIAMQPAKVPVIIMPDQREA